MTDRTNEFESHPHGDPHDVGGVRPEDVPEGPVVDTADGPRRKPGVDVVFSELTIGRKMMHTVSSPPVAYLFFVIGLGLLVALHQH